MTTFNVSTTAALRTALGQAQAGDTIVLASGTYSGLSISGVNPSGNVTITSQNPGAPAILTPFSVSSSSNLTFSHLEMNASGVTGGAYAFQVKSSSNITFDSDFIHGPLGADPNSAATGLLLEKSTNVSVTNSTFQYLQNGMMDTGNNGVLLSGNSFSYMAGDGIDNAGVSNVQVLNNFFTDTVALTNGLHPDAIQFWTAGTTTAMQNITISGNTYVRGSGVGSQGIFIEDDNNLPYNNVSITNNTIIGGLYNGISVYGPANNFTVSDNQLVSYKDYQSFLLLEGVAGGTAANNFANLYKLTGNTNLAQSSDLVNAVVTPGGAPTVANSAAQATYQAGGAAVGLGHFLVVDTNTPTLAAATVAITAGLASGDALNFVNQAGISGSYNAATGVLTLSGVASQAAYQAALDSVTFSSSASDPTHGGTDASRTLSISVNDGSHSSNSLSAGLSVTGGSGPVGQPFLMENTAGAVVLGQPAAGGTTSFSQAGALGPEWTFHGHGDFIGDGGHDFLLENTAGAVVVGEVGTSASYAQIGSLGAEWQFEGVGDFLGLSRDQFIIENTAGAVVVGTETNGQAVYTRVGALGPEWKFVGAGDFLGHGKSDFLIENASGSVVVGEVVNNQATYTTVGSLGSDWHFVGSGDFLGDGKDDFLIQNGAGAVVAGEVSNGQAAYTTLTSLGPEWKFVGANDYFGEGHDQFLIENASGAVVVGDWLNHQLHFTQVASLGPEWNFH